MTHVIDADFAAQVAEAALVRDYLSSGWREHLSTGGGLAGSGYALPSAPYRDPSPLPRDGGDAADRARKLLDRRGISTAVLDPGTAPRLSGIANAMMAAELARATNDWQREQWLGADERLCGSILVGPRDADLAAAEIHRVGEDQRIARIVLAFPPVLLGDRSLRPLFAAAEELELPVSFQAGGAFAGSNPGPAAVGHPTTLFEYRVDSSYAVIPHLVSILCEGLFDRFPGLKLIFSGFGIGWLPSVLWRLDADYASGAVDLPRGLSRLPSESVHQHVAFTTRSIEQPARGEALSELVNMIDGNQLLLYASGDSESDAVALDCLPEPARSLVSSANAERVLRLPGAGMR